MIPQLFVNKCFKKNLLRNLLWKLHKLMWLGSYRKVNFALEQSLLNRNNVIKNRDCFFDLKKSHSPFFIKLLWNAVCDSSSFGLAYSICCKSLVINFPFSHFHLVTKKWRCEDDIHFALTILFAHIFNSPRITIYADTKNVVTDKKYRLTIFSFC